MRAKIAHSAILATAILSVAGCKSGPRWNWWSSKDKTTTEALVNAPGAPQLPSTAASATAAGTPSLNASSATTQAGLAGGTAPTFGAGTYAEQPAAATSYPQSYPSTQTAEYTNPYVGPAAAVNATAAMPNAVGQPQQGAYSPHYQQPAQQSNPYADPYANSRQMPAQESAYGSYGQAPTGVSADPNYRGADPNYRTADSRSTPAYDNRGADAQRYDVNGEMSSPDYTRPSYANDSQSAASASSGNANRYGDSGQGGSANDYKPGASDYIPGNTGYNGPRSYESNPAAPAPGAAAPVGTEPRKDPGYRPAGTSDYLPNGRVGGAAGAGFSTSMNSTPAKASTGNVVTAGYQQPASGDSATPARFHAPDNAPVSTLTIGRRSYE